MRLSHGKEIDDGLLEVRQILAGKAVGYPEIMTQGETPEELEENLRDAYKMMVMDDVPDTYEVKEIVL